MTRFALVERLKELQQTPRFKNRDISTISAMLTIDALAKHVEVCEEAAAIASARKSESIFGKHDA